MGRHKNHVCAIINKRKKFQMTWPILGLLKIGGRPSRWNKLFFMPLKYQYETLWIRCLYGCWSQAFLITGSKWNSQNPNDISRSTYNQLISSQFHYTTCVIEHERRKVGATVHVPRPIRRGKKYHMNEQWVHCASMYAKNTFICETGQQVWPVTLYPGKGKHKGISLYPSIFYTLIYLPLSGKVMCHGGSDGTSLASVEDVHFLCWQCTYCKAKRESATYAAAAFDSMYSIAERIQIQFYSSTFACAL